jgi:hypothetical protein
MKILSLCLLLLTSASFLEAENLRSNVLNVVQDSEHPDALPFFPTCSHKPTRQEDFVGPWRYCLICPGDKVPISLASSITISDNCSSMGKANLIGAIITVGGMRTEPIVGHFLIEAWGTPPAEDRIVFRLRKLIWSSIDTRSATLTTDVDGWISGADGIKAWSEKDETNQLRVS